MSNKVGGPFDGLSKLYDDFFGKKEEKKETLSNVVHKTDSHSRPEPLKKEGISLKTGQRSPISEKGTEVLNPALKNYGEGKDVVCECSQGRLTDVRNALGKKNFDDDKRGTEACAVICFHALQSFMEKGLPKDVKEMYELIDQGVATYIGKDYQGEVYFDNVYDELRNQLPEQLEDFYPEVEAVESDDSASTYSVEVHMAPLFSALQDKAILAGGKACGILTMSGETLVIMFDENLKPALFNSHGKHGQGASLRRFESMVDLAKYLQTTYKSTGFDFHILSKVPASTADLFLPTKLSQGTIDLFKDCFVNGIEDMVGHAGREPFMKQILANEDNVKLCLADLKTLLNGRKLDDSVTSRGDILVDMVMNKKSNRLFWVSPEIKDLLADCLQSGNIEEIIPENGVRASHVIGRILENQEKFKINLEQFKKRLDGKKLSTEDLDDVEKGRLFANIAMGRGNELKLYPTKDGVSLINPNPIIRPVVVSIPNPENEARSKLARSLFQFIPDEIRTPLLKSIRTKKPTLEQYAFMLEKIAEAKKEGPISFAKNVDKEAFRIEFEKVLMSPTKANWLSDWLTTEDGKPVWEMPVGLIRRRELIQKLSPEVRDLFENHFEQGLEGILPENYFTSHASLESIVNAGEVFEKNLRAWSARLEGGKLITRDLTEHQKVNLLHSLVQGTHDKIKLYGLSLNDPIKTVRDQFETKDVKKLIQSGDLANSFLTNLKNQWLSLEQWEGALKKWEVLKELPGPFLLKKEIAKQFNQDFTKVLTDNTKDANALFDFLSIQEGKPVWSLPALSRSEISNHVNFSKLILNTFSEKDFQVLVVACRNEYPSNQEYLNAYKQLLNLRVQLNNEPIQQAEEGQIKAFLSFLLGRDPSQASVKDWVTKQDGQWSLRKP